MTKRLVLLLTLLPTLAAAQAIIPNWQPSTGHTQLPIWPGKIPDARPYTGPEFTKIDSKGVAGKPLVYINNVSVPTMTVYKPTTARNTGAAIVVFPGGGYQILAMDLEGTEVCDWLTARGITCILSKYRVPGERVFPKSGAYPKDSPEALEDAQRTISLIRAHAAEYGIDPHKIGVLGFSAGGHLVAATSVHFGKRIYAAVDAIDKTSCRPDFAIALYPGHLSTADNNIALNPDIANHITHDTPPTFLLQNEDDHVDRVEDSISYFFGLKKAGVPAELHVYAQGGHAFGLRSTGLPATHWPQLVETWMKIIGVLAK